MPCFLNPTVAGFAGRVNVSPSPESEPGHPSTLKTGRPGRLGRVDISTRPDTGRVNEVVASNRDVCTCHRLPWARDGAKRTCQVKKKVANRKYAATEKGREARREANLRWAAKRRGGDGK
jgi:hypothetical protein